MLSFCYNPSSFHQKMRLLAEIIIVAEPNAAHLGFSRLKQVGYVQAIITQNLDDLHQPAGSRNVLEVHGNLVDLVPQLYEEVLGI